MNTRTIRIVCATYVSLGAGISCADQPAVADEPTVHELLQSSYPNFRIKDNSALEADVERVFGDDIDATTTVIADFDGNDLEDYAFLLRDHANTESVLVVYLQTSKDAFEGFEVERNQFLLDYIEEVEPNVPFGPFSNEEKERTGGPVTLSYSAILGVNYAKSSRVVYWDSSSETFKTIWTSD